MYRGGRGGGGNRRGQVKSVSAPPGSMVPDGKASLTCVPAGRAAASPARSPCAFLARCPRSCQPACEYSVLHRVLRAHANALRFPPLAPRPCAVLKPLFDPGPPIVHLPFPERESLSHEETQMTGIAAFLSKVSGARDGPAEHDNACRRAGATASAPGAPLPSQAAQKPEMPRPEPETFEDPKVLRKRRLQEN